MNWARGRGLAWYLPVAADHKASHLKHQRSSHWQKPMGGKGKMYQEPLKSDTHTHPPTPPQQSKRLQSKKNHIDLYTLSSSSLCSPSTNLMSPSIPEDCCTCPSKTHGCGKALLSDSCVHQQHFHKTTPKQTHGIFYIPWAQLSQDALEERRMQK